MYSVVTLKTLSEKTWSQTCFLCSSVKLKHPSVSQNLKCWLYFETFNLQLLYVPVNSWGLLVVTCFSVDHLLGHFYVMLWWTYICFLITLLLLAVVKSLICIFVALCLCMLFQICLKQWNLFLMFSSLRFCVQIHWFVREP